MGSGWRWSALRRTKRRSCGLFRPTAVHLVMVFVRRAIVAGGRDCRLRHTVTERTRDRAAREGEVQKQQRCDDSR